jgi:hypothetical protein
MNNKLTPQEQEQFVASYDTLALYFGGDAVMNVKNKFYQEDKKGFLDWLIKAEKRLSQAGKYVNGLTIKGKYLKTY